MRWLKNKLRNWLLEYSKSAVDKVVYRDSYSTGRLESSGGINFRIYKVNGGFIIESTMYDETTDRNRNSLSIITNEQELGHEIEKIITMECLKN